MTRARSRHLSCAARDSAGAKRRPLGPAGRHRPTAPARGAYNMVP